VASKSRTFLVATVASAFKGLAIIQ